MPAYSFLVTDGPDIGRTFDIQEGITMVGRLEVSSSYDPPDSRRMTLIDKTVSRTHAQLRYCEPGAPLLIHLSVTNDTFVDDRKIQEESLRPGQTIRLGQTTLEVCMDSGWVQRSY